MRYSTNFKAEKKTLFVVLVFWQSYVIMVLVHLLSKEFPKIMIEVHLKYVRLIL